MQFNFIPFFIHHSIRRTSACSPAKADKPLASWMFDVNLSMKPSIVHPAQKIT